jgi:hypothetical protein
MLHVRRLLLAALGFLPLQGCEHLVHGIERAIVGSFVGLLQPGIDEPPLGRYVLVVGNRQFGNDVDQTTPPDTLNSTFWAALKTGTPPNAAGHHECRLC